MENKEILNEITKELGLAIREDNSFLSKELLAEKINELIETDFQKLISILYRMDVNEVKLKAILKDNPGSDAGMIIADLMIERQLQKIESRKNFSSNSTESDDEKW